MNSIFRLFCLVVTTLLFASLEFAFTKETAKTDDLKTYIPLPTGIACSIKEATGNANPSRNITISSDEGKRISFRIPQSWQPGEYVCNWRINILPGSNDGVRGPMRQVRLFFRRVFIGNKDEYKYVSPCEDELTIKSAKGWTLMPDNDLCGLYKRWQQNTGSSSVLLSLKIFVKENEESNKPKTSFVAYASSIPDYNQPKAFDVKDIIEIPSSRNHITDFKFTWEDARNFCREYAQNWDLCSKLPVCEEISGKNSTTQYFPLLDDYNFWEEFQPTWSRCSGRQYYYGPPVWGKDRKTCPKKGCHAKSHIYCCYSKTAPKQKPAHTMPIYVKTNIDHLRNYQYRYVNKPDIYEYEADDPYWDEYWNSIGRLPGDVQKFELFTHHSPDAPTPLYFCSKQVGESLVQHSRYKISLTPCEWPWTFDFHAYARTTPHPNFKALYFGQSNKGDGTRVSLEPFCCGFNETMGSFRAYGIVRKNWIAKVESNNCLDENIFSGQSGTIRSPKFPKQYKLHTSCTWKIRVAPGHSILLQFSEMDFSHPHEPLICRRTYLEITDSERSYGRICRNSVPENFISYKNEIDIHLVSEDGRGRFSFNYTEIAAPNKEPVKFYVTNEDGTWSNAESLCKSKNLTLCRKNDLCPFDIPFGGVVQNTTWVAVTDNHNEWIKIGSDEEDDYRICNLHTKSYGPPAWGERVLNKCQPARFPRETSECVVRRDVVFCCKNLEGQTKERIPKKIRVNLGYATYKYGQVAYWFNINESWNSPEYENWEGSDYDHHDLYDNYGEREIVKPWKPLSSNSYAAEGTIDYFVMSSDYQKEYFDQVVYVCSKELSYGISDVIRKSFKISLNNCEEDENWNLEFFSYAGKNISEKAPIALHVGQTKAKYGSFCCTKNPHSFTIYVISAAKI